MTANEDFLFAQEALAQGFVTEAQVKEALTLQKRMAEELKIDERVGVILVKRGWLADDQARRVHARISPPKGEPGEIHGYRLLEIVGRGAMGTVYRAIHTGLNRTVAIKILRQDLAGDRTQVERLKAEATTLASLDHPNIVRALDAGESNGFPYFVMEFVEGETLRDRMRREGPIPETVALQITRGLADALERARRMGVVHRDVKPGNVLLTRTGIPKLMDLGLAKGPVDLGLTQHGSTVGTPQYIAPEQAVDPRSADTRSDIYGLGATLYAMLTGQPPFDGQTLAEILTKVLYETPVPVRQLRPEISAETGYLVERMMMRDPSLRYRTPALVVGDIDKLTGGNSILPKDFSGNWEAYLLKRRWRKISILVPSTVAVAVAVAFGVKWVVSQGEGVAAREQVESAAESIPPFPPRAGTRADVEHTLAALAVLSDRAAKYGSDKAADLGRVLANYRDELRRFDEFDVADTKAAPLERAGRFAQAEEELRKAKRQIRNDGPAARHLDERVTAIRARSDAALLEARRTTFAVAPRDLDELQTVLSSWSRRVESEFAATVVQKEQGKLARDGVDAATELVAVMRDGMITLSESRVAERIAERKLAALRTDVAGVRDRLERTRTSREEHLQKGGARFVAAVVLDQLLVDPVAARVGALESAVALAWQQEKRQASAKEADGDPVAAGALYAVWAQAASDGGSFVEIAGEARGLRDSLEQQTKSVLERAGTQIADLTQSVANGLRDGRIDRVIELVAEAKARSHEFAPLAAQLASFDRIAPAWDRLYVRALAGISARKGVAREKWIKTLTLQSGEKETLVDVRSVDEAARSFVIVSNGGGFPHFPRTIAISDVSVADLESLAALALDSPDDALTAAVHAFRRLEVDAETRPYDAQKAFGEVAELLDRASVSESPLSQHVRASLNRLARDAGRLEELAESTYLEAEKKFAQGDSEAADARYHDLLYGKYAPSRFAQARSAGIAEMRERIKTQKDFDVVKRALHGARVVRNGNATSDGRDVTVTIDFNRPDLLLNFTSGWALLRNPGRKSEVTPEIDASDRSLLLLPGSPGEIVRDRPLVMPTFLDAAIESSMSFLYWPTAPFFLALDLDGVQVGILSADPQATPFPLDVPRLDGEKDAPRFNHYGLGRGVRFHLGADFGDPLRFGWTEENQGRRFVPPELKKRPKEMLERKWFAFEARDPNLQLPYRVKFVRTPGRGVRLEVDGTTILDEFGEAYKSIRPSERLQILTYTSCLIDDLQFTGRVSLPWLVKETARLYPPKLVPVAPGGTKPN